MRTRRAPNSLRRNRETRRVPRDPARRRPAGRLRAAACGTPGREHRIAGKHRARKFRALRGLQRTAAGLAATSGCRHGAGARGVGRAWFRTRLRRRAPGAARTRSRLPDRRHRSQQCAVRGLRRSHRPYDRGRTPWRRRGLRQPRLGLRGHAVVLVEIPARRQLAPSGGPRQQHRRSRQRAGRAGVARGRLGLCTLAGARSAYRSGMGVRCQGRARQSRGRPCGRDC